MQGGYMYIKGTDIQVGIARVSFDPLHPYAMCTIRLGIKKKYLRNSPLKTCSNRYIKIPFVCLSKFPGIKYNRLMYDATMLEPTPSIEPLFGKSSYLTEGKYEESLLPHTELYEIVKTTIDGKQYYMHILKPLDPILAGIGKCRSFSIFGISELTYRMKKYDHTSGIVTFDTSPVRRAHVSVLRQSQTMRHLGGHTYHWNYSSVSLKDQTTPLDWGWIAGTSIHVKTCIHDPAVSLYKFDKHNIFHWIPIEEITTRHPSFGSPGEDMTIVFPEVYVHGLPIPFVAKAARQHPIHKNPILFLQKEKEAHPLEYDKDRQKEHAVVQIGFKHHTWFAHVKCLSLKPRADYQQYLHHRAQDKQVYVSDYMDRVADNKRPKVM